MSKAASRPPIERMAFISGKLRRREPFNAATVAEHFEVTTKTIHRDIEFMKDRLGFEFRFIGSLNRFVGSVPKRRVL